MTLYKEILQKLIDHPDFRERRKRGKYLMILALRRTGLETKYNTQGKLELDEMVEVSTKYDSYRHEWDAVLKDYPALQGEDYKDGKKLVQQKLLEFGYEPGYHADVKKLKQYA